MAEATLKLVAKQAGVAPVTVSRVVNGSQNVAPATREKILAIIRDLDYKPNIHAASLGRRKFGKPPRDKRTPLPIVPPSPQRESLFLPEDRRVLADHILRLRRDLDRLRKHADRLQTCVDTMQQACSRGLPSHTPHVPPLPYT